ncbi:MAG: hypothetical protein OHK0052_01150 [Anaerolineales bacterium]
MYWFRMVSVLGLAAYAALTALWFVGGLLLARFGLRLRPSERGITGLALGWVVWITLSNLLANLLPLTVAFWVASALTLALGGWQWGVAGWARWRVWRDLHWRQWLALALLTLLFVRIQQGLSLFDEYLHLPLVSVMAAGDMPPHFYLNPNVRFAYHYGLQVWAASLVRLAGMQVWSAFDLARAFAIALTFLLGWLYLRRLTRNASASFWGTLALVIGGGARWLLLLLPVGVLLRLGATVIPANSGADTAATLLDVLARPWLIEGGAPMPFPFAFHSGFFVPVVFTLGSTGALPFVTALLLVLLVPTLRRVRWQPSLVLTLTLIFASLALSAEHWFALLLPACALAVVWVTWRRRGFEWRALLPWGIALFAAGLLSLWQGGYITEIFANLLARLQGVTLAANNDHGFALRFPPGLPTAHLGELSLLDWRQTFVLLLEFGPALILLPWALRALKRAAARRDALTLAIGLSAAFNLMFALFIRYGVDRSTTRFASTFIWLVLLLGLPHAAQTYQRARQSRWLWQSGLAVLLTGGAVMLAIQLTALAAPQFAYFVNGLDAQMARAYWGKLPEGMQVLDADASRGVTVFGRAATAYAEIYNPLPEWEALIAAPAPQSAAQSGFGWIYMDKTWWQSLNPNLRAAFEQPCVLLESELKDDTGDFRRLYDVRACAARTVP